MNGRMVAIVIGTVAVISGCSLGTGVQPASHRAGTSMPLAHKSHNVPRPKPLTWWILESGPDARSIVIQVREAPPTTAGCVVGSSADLPASRH